MHRYVTSDSGQIPDRYPVPELPRANYLERISQNVIDFDSTFSL
jgi:hypothetical protein